MIEDTTVAILGLLVAVAPTPLLPAVAGTAIAAALASRSPTAIERRQWPLALFLAIASFRALASPPLWWDSMLGWLVALAMMPQRARWRRFSPALSLVAAAADASGLIPSTAPAVLLAIVAAFEAPRLGAAARATLATCVGLLIVVALRGAGAEAFDLQTLLDRVQDWWRVQFTGLELARLDLLWGVGPGALGTGGLQALPGLPAGASPTPIVALLAEHGCIGYALLALAAMPVLDRRNGPTPWAAAALLVLAPLSWSSDLLRLAPILGLLAADARTRADEGPLRPLRTPEGGLARGLRVAVAWTVLAGGLAQGAADVLIHLGDGRARTLDWPQAASFYRWAAWVAPQPLYAFQRQSDLAFRRARYRGEPPMPEAWAPLDQVLQSGVEDGWTYYRLAEIAGYSGRPLRLAIALLRHAAQVAPRSAIVRVALGHRLLAAGRPDLAAAEFRTAAMLEPRLLERLFRVLRRVTTNSSLLRQVLVPGDLESHVELARLFEETGLVPAAIREFETLLSDDAAPAWVHREFAALLARSGRLGLALDRLHVLLRWPTLGPRQRLRTLLLLGQLEPDPAQRLSCLQQAVDLLGPDELAGAALTRILAPLAGKPEAQRRLKARAKARRLAFDAIRWPKKRRGRIESCPGRDAIAFGGAGNGIRTRDPNLGKVVLYQLSYSRSTRRRLL